MKLHRNDKCPCGSGKKYKKCCYLDPVKNAELIRAISLANTPEEIVQLISKPLEVYQLKVTLIRMGIQEIEEEVSRTFEIQENSTLFDFHMEIQHAFYWDNDHMFSFYLGDELYDQEIEYSGNPLGEHIVSRFGTPSKSAAATQVRDLGLTEDSTFLYLFDYGDELVHEVKVEKIREKSSEDKKLPTIVSKIGTPPSQYEEFE